VQDRVYAYNADGLAGLNDERGTALQPLLEPAEVEQFVTRVEAGPQPDDQVCSLRGKDFQRILGTEFGKLRSLATVYNLLHQLNYSYLRPRPRHQQADRSKQAAFIANLPPQLSLLAAQYPTKRLRLFFQDEARFGQQGTTTNVWAKTGSRPEAVRQTAYKYLWLSAAVCPETGLAEGLISPRMDTATINAFLKLLSARVGPDEHVVMLWDGAGFHRSKDLVLPANITTIQLPAYSPELNPIENLWHYLKSHHWSNRAYKDHEELEAALMKAWKHSVENNDLMKTVCSMKIFLPRSC
jgi:transposase